MSDSLSSSGFDRSTNLFLMHDKTRGSAHTVDLDEEPSSLASSTRSQAFLGKSTDSGILNQTAEKAQLGSSNDEIAQLKRDLALANGKIAQCESFIESLRHEIAELRNDMTTALKGHATHAVHDHNKAHHHNGGVEKAQPSVTRQATLEEPPASPSKVTTSRQNSHESHSATGRRTTLESKHRPATATTTTTANRKGSAGSVVNESEPEPRGRLGTAGRQASHTRALPNPPQSEAARRQQEVAAAVQDNPNVSNAFQAFKAKDEQLKQKAASAPDRKSIGSATGGSMKRSATAMPTMSSPAPAPAPASSDSNDSTPVAERRQSITRTFSNSTGSSSTDLTLPSSGKAKAFADKFTSSKDGDSKGFTRSPSVPGSARPVTIHLPGGTAVCGVCKKPVYQMEKLEADGGVYHKACFKCEVCKKAVSLGGFAALDGKVFCKPHFKQLFALKGNYNEGFGTQPHKYKWEHEQETEA